MCHGHSTQDELDCKKVGVFLQIGLKETKSSVRDSRTRSARASHALRACEAREKKPTVRFPYNEFVVTRGSKMSQSCQKSIHNSALFVNLIRPVIDFAREQRVLLLFAFGFESSRRSKMNGSGSTPTKAYSCSSKREKTELRASGNCRT